VGHIVNYRLDAEELELAIHPSRQRITAFGQVYNGCPLGQGWPGLVFCFLTRTEGRSPNVSQEAPHDSVNRLIEFGGELAGS